MHINSIQKTLSALLLLLMACCFLTACGKTKDTADIRDFKAACENNGLIASDRQAEDPEGLVTEYAAYEHGTDVLVEYYRFKDTDTALAWYQDKCETAEAGPSATNYEMKGSNFTSNTITADRAYTVVTQVEDTLVIATGPLTYKSALDRILLNIGYLTSNI